MAAWVKNLFLLAVLFGWLVAMLVTLIRGLLPDPIFWSIPTTLWLAMNPPSLRAWNRRETQDDKVGDK